MKRAFASRPALALGLVAFFSAGTAFAADRPNAPRPIFGSTPPFTPATVTPSLGVGPKPVVTLSPQTMVDALRAERDAYTRRLDVCTQLRRVAAELNDDRLAQRALDLEKLAEETYQNRITRLGVKAELRTLSPSALQAIQALRSPTQTLDAKLGAGAAVTPLTVDPPKPEEKTRPATAMSRLQFREVPQQ